MRGVAHFDGFNVYHAVDDLKQPYLKWVSFRRLAELLAAGLAKTIGEVVYTTAYFNLSEEKRTRHERFVRAQEACNVRVSKGHMGDTE